MIHVWTLAQGRKGGIRLVNCSGELAPVSRRPAWISNAAERLFQCQDCGAVLGLVGDSVDWTMSAADWKSLGH
jgi:hypothetical protein